jgi:hypothetical protein
MSLKEYGLFILRADLAVFPAHQLYDISPFQFLIDGFVFVCQNILEELALILQREDIKVFL